MAALMIGMFNFISGVRYVVTSTSRGNTDDFAGTSNTSSKRAFLF
jgi:hypothetical protein